jgi:hypothetical protein
MDTQQPIDDSSPILTDVALEELTNEGAIFEVTLKRKGKHAGRILKDKDGWNVIVAKMDGNSALERGIPFKVEEVEAIEQIVPKKYKRRKE